MMESVFVDKIVDGKSVSPVGNKIVIIIFMI